jgi:hypothetical protein
MSIKQHMSALDSSAIRRLLFPLTEKHREPPAATYSSGNVGLVFIKLAYVRCSRDERVRACFRCWAAAIAATRF